MSKFLLDSSYLFPIFGLETNITGLNEKITSILDDKINQYYYSNITLIEIKWQFMKLEKSKENKTDYQNYFQKYQNILLMDKRFNIISISNSDINLLSDKIRNLGHTDYFDSIIGATSLWYCDFLITEDTSLRKRIIKLNDKENINKEYSVINWKEFLELINS